MSIWVFFSLCFCKDIYLKNGDGSVENCSLLAGCNFELFKNAYEAGDLIHIVDEVIEGNVARDFLMFINSTTEKGASIIGNNTRIANPSYALTSYPAIYIENAPLQLENIVLDGFQIPAINALNSTISFKNVGFVSSSSTQSSLLAFIDCVISGNKVSFENNTAMSQSIVLGLNTQFSLNGFSFVNSYMNSKEERAIFHFLGSKINVQSGNINSNIAENPLFGASNESLFAFNDISFENNDVSTLIVLEFDSKATFSKSIFQSNKGQIISGHSSIASLDNCYFEKQSSESVMISLSDSQIIFVDSNITDSTIFGIILNAALNGSSSINSQRIRGRNLETTLPLFASIGGEVHLNDIRVQRVQSQSEVIVLSHQNGGLSKIKDCKFSKLSAKNHVATSVSIINCTEVSLELVKFSKNDACGAYIENATIYVKESNFSSNQCNPKNSEQPLSLLTMSHAQSIVLEDSIFINNSALTGNLMVINSSGVVKSTVFGKNNAAQGAGLFASFMELAIVESTFYDNKALSYGGAASIVSGSATFDRCNFTRNSASQGGVINADNSSTLKILSPIINNNRAINGSFLSAQGNSIQIYFENVKVDDEYIKALYLSKDVKIDFVGTFFGCVKKCIPYGKSSSVTFPVFWVLPPLMFIIIVLLYRKNGLKGLLALFLKSHRGKRQHKQ